jgi:hypothetical protein
MLIRFAWIRTRSSSVLKKSNPSCAGLAGGSFGRRTFHEPSGGLMVQFFACNVLKQTTHRIGKLATLVVLGVGLANSAQAQILAFTAELDGNQEVPPVPTPATGSAYFVMDRAANTLTLRLTYSGLTAGEVGAHIHGFAAPGATAGIKFGLPIGNTKTAVWNFAEADEANIIAGLCYVNIHSANFGAGEIRGQILRDDSPAFLTAALDGLHEVPPIASTATGTGWARVDTVANLLSYRLTYDGLSCGDVGAHIHGFAAPGATAGIKFTLALGSTKSGQVSYLEADEASILAGLTYFNVHSTNFGAGEIRGQIVPGTTNPSSYCTAKLNSLGCTPQISSTGRPNPAALSGFVVSGARVRNNKAGILFYGIGGGASLPFSGGTLCVATPIRRTPAVNSGGSPAPLNDCSGVYSIDMNAFAQGGLGGTPLPGLGQSGTIVNCQFWGRDPGFAAPNNTTLTDALQYQIP